MCPCQVDASPTRRYGGSGLGLAISRKLCEHMGGRMWAESRGLGQGTTFRWTLACRAPAPVQAPQPGSAPHRPVTQPMAAICRANALSLPPKVAAKSSPAEL
jgi:hypothetical protein